ncbi:MAG: hypothetical protein SFV20_04115 [Sphingopyxis sp.]|nr:hypothetical protein [Sphingopyxis sp.]
MRGARAAMLAAIAAAPLAGCAAAAIPAIAGATIAAADGKTAKPAAQAATAPPAAQGEAAPPGPLPAEFTALVDHVRQRAALWREGAPINSLVLDDRQTVLNPVAIGCARREPLVIIDADPSPNAEPADDAARASWTPVLAAIRAEGVGILWVTAKADADTASLRGALGPGDTIAGRRDAADRKQLIRQRWATTHCILAVVGDTRGDADEAYDYLRSPDAVLPIDSNWGQGWFLLPLPLALDLVELVD